MLTTYNLESDFEFFFNFEDTNVVSSLFCGSCDPLKGQPSPRHKTKTSNSRVSPTTINSRCFVCFL